MNKSKVFERVEEAKSALIDLNNYHLNQLEYMDKLSKELKEISIKKYNEKPNIKNIKDFDIMMNKIQSGIMRASDFQLQRLDMELKTVKSNDVMIELMLLLKEFSEMDIQDIVKTNEKLKKILQKFKEHSELERW